MNEPIGSDYDNPVGTASVDREREELVEDNRRLRAALESCVGFLNNAEVHGDARILLTVVVEKAERALGAVHD